MCENENYRGVDAYTNAEGQRDVRSTLGEEGLSANAGYKINHESERKNAIEHARYEAKRRTDLEVRGAALQYAIASFSERLSEQTGATVVSRAETFEKFLVTGAS